MPAVNQVQFSPFEYRRGLLDECERLGVVLEAYSPLGTGRHLADPTVRRIAEALGRTPAQVLLRWCVQREIPVIPKSTHRGRIEENAQIFDFALSDADIAMLDALDQTGGTDRVLGNVVVSTKSRGGKPVRPASVIKEHHEEPNDRGHGHMTTRKVQDRDRSRAVDDRAIADGAPPAADQTGVSHRRTTLLWCGHRSVQEDRCANRPARIADRRGRLRSPEPFAEWCAWKRWLARARPRHSTTCSRPSCRADEVVAMDAERTLVG